MSKCNFSIPFNDQPSDVYARAKAAVEKQGGEFNGTEQSGSFSINVFGKIAGTYQIAGRQIDISIDEKPLMIPCSAIENVLQSQIK